MLDIYYNRTPKVTALYGSQKFAKHLVESLIEDDTVVNISPIATHSLIRICNIFLKTEHDFMVDDSVVKTKNGRLFKIVFNEDKHPYKVTKLGQNGEYDFSVNVYECNKDSFFYPLFKKWVPVRCTTYSVSLIWE